MSARDKAFSGLLWASFNQFGQIGLQFIVGITLARLLSPADYGLFALIGVFLVFFCILVEGGLGMAIIQRKDLTDEDISTVFWFNLAASCAAYGLIWLGAPLLAAFFSEPDLTAMTRVIAFSMVIGAFSRCQGAQLERQMAFRKLTAVQLPSFIFSAMVAIGMALLGYGPWSLVAMSIAASSTSCIILWRMSSWRPTWCFNRNSFRSLFRFGIYATIEKFNDALLNNLLTIVIGRVFTPAEVGYYNRARHYKDLPAHTIYSVLTRVMLPLLSSVQNQPEKLRRAFSHSLRLASLISFPVFLGLAAVAEPLVVWMIGPKWLPSVPYLQILCLSATFLPVQALNVNAILSQGRSGLSLKISLIKQSLSITAICLTFPHGIIAMLWGQTATSILAFFINAWPNRKLMRFPILDQIRIMAPYAMLSSVMSTAVMLCMPYLPSVPWIQVSCSVSIGVSIYLIGLKLMRLPAHIEIANLTTKIPILGKAIKLTIT